MVGDLENISLIDLRNILTEFLKKVDSYERKIREKKFLINGAFQAANIIVQELSTQQDQEENK